MAYMQLFMTLCIDETKVRFVICQCRNKILTNALSQRIYQFVLFL